MAQVGVVRGEAHERASAQVAGAFFSPTVSSTAPPGRRRPLLPRLLRSDFTLTAPPAPPALPRRPLAHPSRLVSVGAPMSRGAAAPGTRPQANQSPPRYACEVYAGHLDLTHPLAWTIDGALEPDTCAQYIHRMTALPAEVAPIVGHDGAPEIDLATRNNTRVMWDDATEADALLARVASRSDGGLRHGALGSQLRGCASTATRPASATACTGTPWSSSTAASAACSPSSST